MAALETGLSYREAMGLPLGELLDILAAFSVRSGRRVLKSAQNADGGEFWALMERA